MFEVAMGHWCHFQLNESYSLTKWVCLTKKWIFLPVRWRVIVKRTIFIILCDSRGSSIRIRIRMSIVLFTHPQVIQGRTIKQMQSNIFQGSVAVFVWISITCCFQYYDEFTFSMDLWPNWKNMLTDHFKITGNSM